MSTRGPALGRTAMAIKALRNEKPCISAAEIARRVGVSRERVRQLLRRLGLTTDMRIRPKRRCLSCGNPIPRDHRAFCSRACQVNYYQITLYCNFCGKEFKRKVKDILLYPVKLQYGYKGRVFCSRSCLGRWFGKNYGRGRGLSIERSEEGCR